MKNFEGLGLHSVLEKSLAYMKYTTPTPIQAQAIPLALEGHDIMGTAQTGTGKTAAFAIPLVEKLLNDEYGTALVLTPTRELGKQIMDIMHQLLGPTSRIKTAFIIGGESMGKQVSQLRARPRLIVGTPGRINDHLERGNMMLDDAHFLVLDETDRMLDMGFTIQLEKIFKYMPDQRQTLMFSATLPKNILKLSERYMQAPKRVSVGETNVVASNIKQEVIRIEQDKKYDQLIMQLHERTGSVIVFVKTKFGADRMAKNLRRDGFTSEALHGDLRQTKRDKVMVNFRKQNFRVLIATDIAARGLDVPHIEHVINYDLPQVAEDYIHRMGRTARAGAQGSAISFVSNQDGRKWHAIECLIDPDAARAKGNGERKRSNDSSKKRGGPKSSGRRFKRGAEESNARRDTRGESPSKKPFKSGKPGSKDGFNKDRQDMPKKKASWSGERKGAGKSPEHGGAKKSFRSGPKDGQKQGFKDQSGKKKFTGGGSDGFKKSSGGDQRKMRSKKAPSQGRSSHGSGNGRPKNSPQRHKAA